MDDDAAFRHVMSGELRRLGHEVSTAASGEEAVDHIGRREPEIILLDLRLPGMDGLETLKAIRGQNPAIEVIMLTGHGSIDSAIESIREGAFDYVTKPCPLDEIRIRVQRAIERRALRQRASLLERALTPSDPDACFVGESPEFRRMLHLVDLVGPRDSTVLIAGETGSGKERVIGYDYTPTRSRVGPAKFLEGYVRVSAPRRNPSICASWTDGRQADESWHWRRWAYTKSIWETSRSSSRKRR